MNLLQLPDATQLYGVGRLAYRICYRTPAALSQSSRGSSYSRCGMSGGLFRFISATAASSDESKLPEGFGRKRKSSSQKKSRSKEDDAESRDAPKASDAGRERESASGKETKEAATDDKQSDKPKSPKEADDDTDEVLDHVRKRLQEMMGSGANEKGPKGKKGDKKSGKGSGDKKGAEEEGEMGMGQTAISMITTALTFAVLAYLFGGRGESNQGREVSWQELRSEYLAKGLVDRVEIVNKEVAKVYLRQEPDKTRAAPEHRSDTGEGSDGAWHDDAGQQPAGAAGRPRPGSETVVHFRIGSVDTFERQLEDAQLDFRVPPSKFVPVRHVQSTDWGSALLGLLPTLLILGIIVAAMRGAGGGMPGGPGGPGGGPMSRIFNIGKSNAQTIKPENVNVSFKDVAGCDEAKREIMEFVEFLKSPARFTKLGAKIPKGALLVGPPGTGKTLLARATAGEASVPFLSISGSDFVEMFVGVGASRVRDLFEKARKSTPCIVFIDEIDAVARKRNQNSMGGNDERENTLNQLLVEMDGFSSHEGVVVLAGTNRADVLDPAILRPGRFDRQITVDRPDIRGRMEIFKVHLKDIQVDGDKDAIAKRLAALTPGFAGAEIRNICNEAAIFAARRKKDAVTLEDFDSATDRVIGGLEKRNSLMTPEEKRTVAFHEAGHAVVGWFLEHADPLLKVTIVPRTSGALGFAQYLPKEVALHTTEALVDRMCMALGGRAAEEVHFGRITTGAQDDLDKVTQMAYAMTTVYGMNPKVGQLSFRQQEGGGMPQSKPYSDSTAQMIDEEVRTLVEGAYKRTLNLVRDKTDLINQLATRLLEKETIAQEDIVEILGERPFTSSKGYKDYVSTAFGEDADEMDARAAGSGGTGEGGEGGDGDGGTPASGEGEPEAEGDEEEEEDKFSKGSEAGTSRFYGGGVGYPSVDSTLRVADALEEAAREFRMQSHAESAEDVDWGYGRSYVPSDA